jgi:hypothetical protein
LGFGGDLDANAWSHMDRNNLLRNSKTGYAPEKHKSFHCENTLAVILQQSC